MIGWAAIAAMLLCAALTVVLYALSVRPASLSARVGERAYASCARYRLASVVTTAGTVIFAVLCGVRPPDPFLRRLPWPRAVSVTVAIVVALPAAWLAWRGIKDAGAETMRPGSEQGMFRGVYERVRHPQSFGALLLWWALALACDSPVLLATAVAGVPVWMAICHFEEMDLVRRFGTPYETYRKRTGFAFPKRQVRR